LDLLEKKKDFLKGLEILLANIGEKWAIILIEFYFWETAKLLEIVQISHQRLFSFKKKSSGK